VTTISKVIALSEVEAANDAHTVWANTACRKDHSQKNQKKTNTVVSQPYNQIASDIWENDNPVH